MCSGLDNLNNKSINKKALKEKYKLLFELVHRVLVPRTKRRGTVTGPDLYLMEIVSTFQKVNLLAVVIEHFNIVMFAYDRNHAYLMVSG